MNRNSYQEVLSDLEADKERIRFKCNELKIQYEAHLQKSNEIESAIQIIKSKLAIEDASSATSEAKTENNTLLPENAYSKENQSKVSLCEGSEKVLEIAGKPMHLKVIIKELEKYGRFTDNRILNGTIRKDHRKRFVNLGQNVWDLRRRHEQPSKQ